MNKSSSPKHIIITNIVSLNTGDAAILWGMLQILRDRYGSDARFTVFDKSAAAASKYYPWARFRQSLFGNSPRSWIGKKLQVKGYGHWLERIRYIALGFASYLIRWKFRGVARLFLNPEDLESVSEYVNADLVVSTGGTYLTENYGLWTNIRDYRLTLLTGTPLVFFTQTLGPFTRPAYRRAFYKIFSKSAAIFLRDERSKQHVIELGISETKVTLAKDPAFVIHAETRSNLSDQLHIAFSVRTMHFFDESRRSVAALYKSCVIEMVSAAVRNHGAQVTFLSTCQGIPEYWTDDTKLAEEILSSLPDDVLRSVTIDRRFRQPTEIVTTYQTFDLVVATRMHAAILSLVAGTPVVGIAYEFKLEELFNQLHMDDVRLSTRDMDEVTSLAVLAHALNDMDRFKERVLAVQAECRKQAEAVIDSLPNV